MRTSSTKKGPSVQAAVEDFIRTNSAQGTVDVTTATREPIVGTPPRLPIPPGIRHNPDTWQWRLARWLIGGKFEAAAVLPLRPIFWTDTLVVRLGNPGALNTVEVKHPDMATVDELLPIADLDDLYPDTFVLIELTSTSHEADGPDQILGTFRGWRTEAFKRRAVIETRAMGSFAIAASDIKAAYYAPAGYQL